MFIVWFKFVFFFKEFVLTCNIFVTKASTVGFFFVKGEGGVLLISGRHFENKQNWVTCRDQFSLL